MTITLHHTQHLSICPSFPSVRRWAVVLLERRYRQFSFTIEVNILPAILPVMLQWAVTTNYHVFISACSVERRCCLNEAGCNVFAI